MGKTNLNNINAQELEELNAKPLINTVLTLEYKGGVYQKVIATLYERVIIFKSETLALTIKYSDIISVTPEKYKIFVILDGENIVLSMLGHAYEDFAKLFIRACNQVFFIQSLMKERVYFEARGQYISPDGKEEPALFRICETAIVVLPNSHQLVRIPFCIAKTVDRQPYSMKITDRAGRTYVIEKLGWVTDRFFSEYDIRLSQLLKLTTERLSEIAPVSNAVAQLMLEGIVSPIADIRKASASFADSLDGYLAASAISKEYAYLKTVSDDLAFGIKRGLMGELTGDSIVILASIPNKKRVIMESLGAAAATYVFDMDSGFLRFLPLFNESMLAVNFRREPIYLSEDALNTDRYKDYRYAIVRCPALAKLRKQFIGRIAHRSFERWESSLSKYIN